MPVNIPITSKPRIVIVGGGFGGIELAKRLRHVDAQVVLVDKNNYHTFQPLLYQVATAALEADSIAYPLREIFRRQKNILFRMAEVLRVKPGEQAIETSIGDITYDYLVLALGSKTNYFGMDDVRDNAVPMKTVPQAVELRNRILESFEKALLTTDLEERDQLMSFVVVGGGPTGIETVGALAELKKMILPRDYPELDLQKMQIHIVDMEDRLLKTMSEPTSRSADTFLKRFDVNIWLKAKVLSYDGETLVLSNGKQLRTKNLIWAAGVTGAGIPGLAPEAVGANNRIRVDVYNQVLQHERIFAVGDIAAMITDKTPRGYPMVAPVAIQQARNLADNLARLMQGRPLRPFRYRDLGVMATIGRNHAVVDLAFLKIQGVVAWFVWLFVHLMALVGFRNKIVALVNWAWNYFSYDRGLRLIVRPFLRLDALTQKWKRDGVGGEG